MRYKKNKWPTILMAACLMMALGSCQNHPTYWPKGNSTKVAHIYKLPMADSTNIFTWENGICHIIAPQDSAFLTTDTVFYNSANFDADSCFAHLPVMATKQNFRKPAITEYYTFANDQVLLLGYTTGNADVPAVAFEKPLVIVPAFGQTADTTVTVMQNWDTTTKQFVNDNTIKTMAKSINQGTMQVNGQPEEVALYHLTLVADAKVGYGAQQLVMPEAIVIRSHLLFGKTQGLMAEWSIKAQQTKATGKPEHEQPTYYIELIKYK